MIRVGLVALVASCCLRAAGIAGCVLDPQGRGVPAASIRLDSGAKAGVDERGSFRFDSVAPGGHALSATAPGFWPAAASVTAALESDVSLDVTLAAPMGPRE